jgi:hypothetical protein
MTSLTFKIVFCLSLALVVMEKKILKDLVIIGMNVSKLCQGNDSIDGHLLPVPSLEKEVGFASGRASGSKRLCQNHDDEFPESTQFR